MAEIHSGSARDEMGLTRNTLIIFSSDNGPEILQSSANGYSAGGSAGPFRGRKRSIYEGGVRVPFIVSWPGHALDGEDVSDILLGASRPRARPLFWEWRFHIIGEPFHRSPMLAVREGDWKLLMNPDRSRVELYDIPRDPTELSNQAGNHPGVVASLSEKLLAWQETLPRGPIDPTAGKNNYPWPGKATAPINRKIRLAD